MSYTECLNRFNLIPETKEYEVDRSVWLIKIIVSCSFWSGLNQKKNFSFFIFNSIFNYFYLLILKIELFK